MEGAVVEAVAAAIPSAFPAPPLPPASRVAVKEEADAEEEQDGESSSSKRKRTRNTSFAGFQLYGDEARAGGEAGRQRPKPARGPLTSASGGSKKQPSSSSSSSGCPSAKSAGSGVAIVKKTPGVQNATRKVLDSLRRRGPLTIQDIASSLPKLSKAKVHMVLEVLRSAGLVCLVRRKVEGGNSLLLYQFRGVKGGTDAISLGNLSSDIRAREAEILSVRSRIASIEAELKKPEEKTDAGQVALLARMLSKSEKGLEDDPLYQVVRAVLEDGACT